MLYILTLHGITYVVYLFTWFLDVGEMFLTKFPVRSVHNYMEFAGPPRSNNYSGMLVYVYFMYYLC